jgi:hypothetical protein
MKKYAFQKTGLRNAFWAARRNRPSNAIIVNGISIYNIIGTWPRV